jgi:addiction module HigA family antidote
MAPVHPGEILLEEFLKPLGVSQYQLAKAVSVSDRRINEIVHAQRRISADAAGAEIAGATHTDYNVVMSKRAATPVRFDPSVADRLSSFVAANPGMSLSSAANRLVDEALRMAEHPGVIFRSGPTGRRAALAGGPDVWEVIRAVKSAHAAEPGLNGDDLISLVSDNTGIALRLVSTAVRYWAAYPSEVDAEIAAADAAEAAAEQAWLRERQLLAG